MNGNQACAAFATAPTDVPSGGDPNGDGASDDVEDELLELANVSDATLDLSGVAIVETDFPTLPRHTFANGTVLRAGEAVVVFGGGSVSRLSKANGQFFVVDNDYSPGTWVDGSAFEGPRYTN